MLAVTREPIELGRMDERKLRIEDHKGRWVHTFIAVRAERAAPANAAKAQMVNAPTAKRATKLPQKAASGPVCQMSGWGADDSCHSDRP